MRFDDRRAAGRRLAWYLDSLRGHHLVVLGLPRGGVPVAYEVALELGAPLDVLQVRKLAVPWQPELAFGALAESGVCVHNEDVIQRSRLDAATRDTVQKSARDALDRCTDRWRALHDPVPLTGRTALIVDDGMATGATATAACRAARLHGASRVVLAAPVASLATVRRLKETVADAVHCPQALHDLGAIGSWYDDFTQTSDEEVEALVARAAQPVPTPRLRVATTHPSYLSQEVFVPAAGARLAGQLAVPDSAPAVVLLAHGSGTSRYSPRSRSLAAALHRAGLGTLLLDLLTGSEEEYQADTAFALRLLTTRLDDATRWLHRHTELPVCYFAVDTAVAAALEAAAAPGSEVLAVVCRSGRPDLVGRTTPARLRAPVLFVVGSRDTELVEVNREASGRIACESGFAVVPGGSHEFTEPEALETSARLTRDWFLTHLTRPFGPARSGPPVHPLRPVPGPPPRRSA
ncbi:phosphoribosyltransferase family protein [Streptomyces sp. VRA16 Mangrove soil]|uniref:phosphoribosyltransferase family protein n=1 Tax=Streptomyces sp. VRA16 Mangrove soil TaxID=2817434 RepID=UPI001A9FAD55|nr:phosphoribosyltransferase family protein [Streptomyces sp. VRA16 Mangrove soil]MBO1337935.1 phosphoribosyltransferase [Streptomyces sp. VRA16 Mangrove soil]